MRSQLRDRHRINRPLFSPPWPEPSQESAKPPSGQKLIHTVTIQQYDCRKEFLRLC